MENNNCFQKLLSIFTKRKHNNNNNENNIEFVIKEKILEEVSDVVYDDKLYMKSNKLSTIYENDNEYDNKEIKNKNIDENKDINKYVLKTSEKFVDNVMKEAIKQIDYKEKMKKLKDKYNFNKWQ
ncbi:hypothetical protein CL656_05275 [bacterium]|nr:hypothetical protein [bacterium]|tara:strand:+ start:338 stop:712 length:375 start_codon:yes stop_codon:yes gene_type:complete